MRAPRAAGRRATLAAVMATAGAACVAVAPRFPDDVQAAVASQPMRRLETERFVAYYPAHRRAEVARVLARADRCASALRARAEVRNELAAEKMILVLPDAPFNNAYVAPTAAGEEHVAVIPTFHTLDFATEFGLPPDPGHVACHELVHYVQGQQIGGVVRVLDRLFGEIYTPQLGFDPWFWEGLATYYEALLQPGAGRPRWPIFTGMFAAGYAGRALEGGDLSHLARRAGVGHAYLVGTMFVRFLVERYGERAPWAAIAQLASQVGLSPSRALHAATGRFLGALVDEFAGWARARFPARPRPAAQRRLATLGEDARYARGRDGTEAWVAGDADAPTRLVVRGPDGRRRAALDLVDVVPPRAVAIADPLLVSGLSLTADGGEAYLTVVDLGATYQTTRLLRWRAGAGLDEVAHGLGPGATVSPDGRTYFHARVDGDRWGLAAYDLATGADRLLVDAPPGTYVLGAQASPDGAELVASVWDGAAFVLWRLDARTGARRGVIRDEAAPSAPLYDPSYLDDGRLVHLGVVDERFQVVVRDADGGRPRVVTDAPYATLAPRGGGGALRFLNREGWAWTLDEVPLPPPLPPATPPAPTTPEPSTPAARPGAAPAAPVAPPEAAPLIVDDRPYRGWDHLLVPRLRVPIVGVAGGRAYGGLLLAGGDRLGLHRWTASAWAQPAARGAEPRLHLSAAAGYRDASLAPWALAAGARQVDLAEDGAGPAGAPGAPAAVPRLVEHRGRDAYLSASRTWRGALALALGATASEDRVAGAGADGRPRVDLRRLAGLQLAAAWLAGDGSRIAGLQRALGASVELARYPGALSTLAGPLTDLGAGLSVRAPLPLGRRHTLAAALRGRALVGGDAAGLLRLGGEGALRALWRRASAPGGPAAPAPDDERAPPALRFAEPLRGYEDLALATDRAATAELGWRYPVVVDRGLASTLWILPASFVRQLDLELFATAAAARGAPAAPGPGAAPGDLALHGAAGGALTLRVQLLRLPLVIAYQVARRLRDDHAFAQLLGVGLDVP